MLFFPVVSQRDFAGSVLGEINGLMKVVIFAVQKIRWLLTLKHVIVVICAVQNQSLPSKVQHYAFFEAAWPFAVSVGGSLGV